MLEFSEPKWKASPLWYYSAPLELGSLILPYWTNSIHCAYCHRMHCLSSLRNYFYACNVSSENKTWCFSPAGKAVDECWEVCGAVQPLLLVSSLNLIHFSELRWKSITTTLISMIKKVESSTPTITYVNEDSYHLFNKSCTHIGWEIKCRWFNNISGVTNTFFSDLLKSLQLHHWIISHHCASVEMTK